MAKKRIPNLPLDTDLYEAFTGEKESKTSENTSSFAELLEKEGELLLPQENKESDPIPKNRGKLLKKYPQPQKTIDLHGMTQAQAEQQIRWVVKNALASSLLTLKFITGRGLHSKDGIAILPDMTEKTLRIMKQEKIILDFKWEKKSKKSGVVIVYL